MSEFAVAKCDVITKVGAAYASRQPGSAKARIEEYAREMELPATYLHVAFYYENFLSHFPPRRQADGAGQGRGRDGGRGGGLHGSA